MNKSNSRTHVLPVSATIAFIHGVVSSGRAAELLYCIVAVHRPRQPAGEHFWARAGRLRGGKWCSCDGRGRLRAAWAMATHPEERRIAPVASDECAIEERYFSANRLYSDL